MDAMKTIIFFCLLFFTTLLSGCATSMWGDAGAGGAVYVYEKTGDDCTLTITSGREVSGGGDILIDSCNVTVQVEKMGGSDTALATIQSLVHQLLIVTGRMP